MLLDENQQHFLHLATCEVFGTRENHEQMKEMFINEFLNEMETHKFHHTLHGIVSYKQANESAVLDAQATLEKLCSSPNHGFQKSLLEEVAKQRKYIYELTIWRDFVGLYFAFAYNIL
jgi:hypothetical protein